MKKNSMKILVIFNRNLFYVEGASSNRFRTIFEGLALRNVEIHILIAAGYFEWEEYLFHNRYKYPKNIFIHYIGFPYLLRSIKRIKYQSLRRSLIINKQKELQTKINFDYGWITYGLKNDIYLESIDLFKREGAKIIQEMSEHPVLFMSKNEYNEYLKLICPQVDIMLLMTNGLLDFYSKYIQSSKLYHIPMTVDLDRFSKSKSISKENIWVISYVGLMKNKKDGVDVLIKAFAAVSKEFKNIRLQLIGPKKPKEDYLEQLNFIENNNLENIIEYLGEKPRSEIPQLLIDSDCLVLARPSSKQAQFGFPTKLGEYLATGNPVVATSVGEIPFYLKNNNNAFIAQPNDVDDFADKIMNVLKDKKNAVKIGKRGFETANEYFNAEIQSDRILKILQDNLEAIR